MDPQTLLDSTFFLIPSFMPKKGLDPQVSRSCDSRLVEWQFFTTRNATLPLGEVVYF